MTLVKDNSVQAINTALLSVKRDISALTATKSTCEPSSGSTDETTAGLEPGKTYNINISGNAATATRATSATTAETATNANHAATAETADKATSDANGNNIVNTYATKTELADKQDFRIFNSLEEFNEKKGTSLTVVSGIDNMKDIANAMSNGEILIILVRYELNSEVYFGLTPDTGWTKMFTFIKSNGLCDVECRTTYPLTIKRVLNSDGVVGDWQQVATMDKVAQCVENKTPNAKTVSFELNSATWNCGTIYGNTNNGGNFKYDYYVTWNSTVGLVKQDGYGPQGSITASLSGTTLTLTASENTTIKTVTVIKT